MRAGLAIAGAAERPEQRRVDEAAGQATPRATPPRPRPAAAARRDTRARIGVQTRQIAARVKARQPAVDLGEHRRHVDARRRRRARPAQPCPSSGSCRRARAPSVPRPSAVRRVLARRRRGLGSHVGAVGLLQVRDLPRTGLCRHRRQRQVALCARRGRVAADRRRRMNSPSPSAAAAAASVQRA